MSVTNTFAVTEPSNVFGKYFQKLTDFINANYAAGITMELSAPGPSPGAPVQAKTVYPSGGAIVGGTAFPAPAQPTITVT